MRQIAVVNMKGGVGKTRTAIHLAAGLAASGSRVPLPMTLGMTLMFVPMSWMLGARSKQ